MTSFETNLCNFGVDSLSHLDAAVRYGHGAVAAVHAQVDVILGAPVVVVVQRRDHGEAPLFPEVPLIKRYHGLKLDTIKMPSKGMLPH